MPEGLRVVLSKIDGITEPNLLERDLAFQVPPLDEWGVDYSHAHTRYTTIRRGEYSRRAGRALRTSSWNTLALDTGIDARGEPVPSFAFRYVEVEDITHRLLRICESGTPFLYTAEHPFDAGGFRDRGIDLAGPEAQWPAVLERLSVREKAGEGDARYFAMEFTEYRDPVTDRQQKGKAKRRTGGRKFPAHAVLQKDGTARETDGDRIGTGTPATLVQLARHYYHDPSMARAIAVANDLRSFGFSDPLIGHRRLKAGSKLAIPKPAVASINPPS